MIEDFDLEANEALVRLARIVHAADIDGQLDTDPAGPGRVSGVGPIAAAPYGSTFLHRSILFNKHAYNIYCS